jgi:hypothetical protein
MATEDPRSGVRIEAFYKVQVSACRCLHPEQQHQRRSGEAVDIGSILETAVGFAKEARYCAKENSSTLDGDVVFGFDHLEWVLLVNGSSTV